MIGPAIILTHPSASLCVFAAGVVAVLYLRPTRPPSAVVVRPHLWQAVLGEPRSSAASWRRRRILSAALLAGIVVLLALAATDPCWNPPRTVVFVVDTSESMEAGGSNAAWLAETKAAVKKHLDTIGPREYAALISTAGQPLVVCPAEQNPERFEALLQRLHPASLPSQIGAALELAKLQAVAGTQLQIHVLARDTVGNPTSHPVAASEEPRSFPPETAGYAVRPLALWLVLAAIVLLAAEWALFHRRHTC